MKTTLQKWTLPRDYFGAEWPDWYVFLSQNRDSDIITESNFKVAYDRLQAIPQTGTVSDDPDSDTCIIVRASHWACGWVEWIAIHESDTARLAAAQKMLDALNQYPLLDEDDVSQR
jgi:hypothetical protein